MSKQKHPSCRIPSFIQNDVTCSLRISYPIDGVTRFRPAGCGGSNSGESMPATKFSSPAPRVWSAWERTSSGWHPESPRNWRTRTPRIVLVRVMCSTVFSVFSNWSRLPTEWMPDLPFDVESTEKGAWDGPLLYTKGIKIPQPMSCMIMIWFDYELYELIYELIWFVIDDMCFAGYIQ